MRFLPLPLLLLAQHTSASLLSPGQHPIQEPDTSSKSPLLELHKSLVKHESITGNEHNVAKYLVSYLKGKNFTVETQEVGPFQGSTKPRENIYAYIGKQRKTKVLVSSHIDTVPPFWPYERKGDEIWGRGSVDAKGSVATQIIAVEELLAADKLKEGDVSLLFVVGEEVGGDGMRKANDLGLTWDTAIFGEPTELKLASGHKGTMSFDIVAKGKAGHSGYPELGKSANAMLIPALNLLLNAKMPSSDKYGNSTLNIGKMEGGVAANVIAEDASAKVSIRLAAGTPADIKKIVLDTLLDADAELDVIFSGGGYGPIYIDSDVPGFETIVVNYGTDIPNLKGDHKRYLYGPGTILMAHSDHEHLEVKDLETAVKGYKTLIEYSLK
ncbi:putative carboxypeptidase [Lachnellula suecica]|uniref:Putative carboxypeptidase n=1 Tax=Lachnellula suecica TaxID=602035 RepID=A0A8T9CMD3_9HELO|nr:putative carboxypeptidase [Lachnellula suecica]